MLLLNEWAIIEYILLEWLDEGLNDFDIYDENLIPYRWLMVKLRSNEEVHLIEGIKIINRLYDNPRLGSDSYSTLIKFIEGICRQIGNFSVQIDAVIIQTLNRLTGLSFPAAGWRLLDLNSCDGNILDDPISTLASQFHSERSKKRCKICLERYFDISALAFCDYCNNWIDCGYIKLNYDTHPKVMCFICLNKLFVFSDESLNLGLLSIQLTNHFDAPVSVTEIVDSKYWKFHLKQECVSCDNICDSIASISRSESGMELYCCVCRKENDEVAIWPCSKCRGAVNVLEGRCEKCEKPCSNVSSYSPKCCTCRNEKNLCWECADYLYRHTDES